MSVLGPVTVQRAQGPVPLGGAKVRTLLAVLVARHGRVVSTDGLCQALWGDELPGSAATTLQSHVSRLRRVIEPEATVTARPPGYALESPAQAIDADRFEVLAELAGSLDDDEVAGATYGEALALWRGAAYEEVADHEMLVGEAVRLEELRLAVTERWIDTRLRVDDDLAVIGDLERLVAGHSLRERFWCQLMVALHRSGRQAEALRRAHQLHTLMRDEFGLEVSVESREIEAQIRADDPRLRARRELAAPTGARPATVVAEDPSSLVGRDADVVRLTELVRDHRLVSLGRGLGQPVAVAAPRVRHPAPTGRP